MNPFQGKAASPSPGNSAARYLLKISFLSLKSQLFAPRCPNNSARLPSPPTESRTSEKKTTQQTSPRPREAKLTSQRLKKEKKETQTRKKLVSHGVRTVLACSSQNISDYLLPIYYKCNVNKCHSQSKYLPIFGEAIDRRPDKELVVDSG